MSLSTVHLKLDGIKGESTSAQHPDEVVVDSWTWGVEADPTPVGGGAGAGAGKPGFSDLTFSHRVDRASPELWKACATGRHIREAILTVSRNGAPSQDYIIIKLKDVIVTSAAMADASADALAPIETVSLAFAKLDYAYRPQNSNGTLGTAVSFKYDVRANRVI
jgi:type VI secretion system secreted protein Hcp